ncbi:hypothetical protein MTsPCn9_13410 [Croceitalea sp. MTPC9]|uniref:DUF6503 family protein n=1 Tax=unclassified Croceitalea TaxID=2632280 RepID=UPI002B3A24D1|nr:hypothetical protein MTsPCn6_15720 [Croceitalea sp. MTPC6]GMN16405.1 hypothetical protein MTsPCn9_13410 [Croceitalea sp. MTPC9]
MKKCVSCILMLLTSIFGISQELTGNELLQKSIAFHDPNGAWETFKGGFQITMETTNSSDRISKIHIDLPREEFVLDVKKGNDSYAYLIEKDSCKISLNGDSDIPVVEKKRLRLSCERGNMMKNYYTYLYGLPMKLKDPGTIITQKIEKRTFKEKQYLVLKVNYTKEVGGDTWYFYFDPVTYAMEVYQFFHDENKNDGEYILLQGLENINEIKMPKTRAWYYNKDDKYLGTDILSPN